MIIKIRNGAAILIIIVNNYSLVRMEKVIMRKKIYNYLVILIFLELVLGGLGNLFGLPIRKGLFVVGILYTLYMIYADRIRISKTYLGIIAVVLIYVAFGSVVGLVKGNSLGAIFADANSFLGIIYLLLLAVYFRGDSTKINKGISIIANASVVVALITIGLFFYSRIFLPGNESIIVAYMALEEKLKYGFISGLVHSNNYARVFLFNGIFMEIGALVYMIRLMSPECRNRIVTTIKMAILFIGIYVSSTRGFWLGTAVGVGIALGYYLFRVRKRKFKIASIAIVFAVLVIFINVLPKTIDTVTTPQTHVGSGTESTKDRVDSILDFQNNASNQVRLIQLKFLLNEFKKAPIVGAGFGASLNEYSEYMMESSGLTVDPSNFELYYVELLYKTGVIGIVYFFGYFLYKFIQLVRMIIKVKLSELDEEVLATWTIGFIAFLVSSVTNPYLASLSGIFVLTFECYVLQNFLEKYNCA